MLIQLAAALAALVTVMALVFAFLRTGSTARATERRIAGLSREPMGVTELRGNDLLTRRSSPIPILQKFISKNDDWAARTAMELQQAGLQLRVSEYLLLRVLMGGVAGALIFVLFRLSPLGILAGVVVGVIGFLLPMFWVRVRRSRRQAKIAAQLVETLNLISNALRSGFAFTQAVEVAAKQMDVPIKEELNYFLRDTLLGARQEDALNAMVARTGSLDLDMLVTTILVQKTAGGNLSEVLDNVAETIRERDRLRGEIKALTATQRLTGQILSIYPLALAMFLTLMAPSLMKVLVTDEVGRILLGIAITLQIAGALAIRRILSLDV
jgi:tight adherence protein B